MQYLSPKIINLFIVCGWSCDLEHVLNLAATIAAVPEACFHDYTVAAAAVRSRLWLRKSVST